MNTENLAGDIVLTAGGGELRFPADWLRDNCPCAQCRDADGGGTGLVDGVAAAANLRAMDREAFDVLTATAVPFGYIDKETELRARLAEGVCLIFDNARILHARTAFSMSAGSSGRHLQGCYADLDGLASTRAVLEREETP